jgi:transketolase
VVRDGDDVTIIATGSEVHITVEAADRLAGSGISARVVSLPCWELFMEQDADYRERTLGAAPRVSVEAAATFGWSAIVGDRGLSIGIDRFGASAPDTVLAEKFGFTAGAIAARVKEFLGG